MKKIGIILILMLYGASSFGITVHFHYCCGKLDKIDFTPPKDNHCGNGKTHKMGSKPCCDNKQVAFKITGEQNVAKVYQSSFHFDAVKPFHQDYFVSSPLKSKNLLPEIFAPPPSSQPLFILHRIFRI
ncbi:MAG: hypothetical protein M3342_09125 [Bacteroidota bacterium]|nr:hypothetical protein [Flavisolibacter sp.]MDQ3844160.1 hypothetical protein [Bacteroidota bacterium]